MHAFGLKIQNIDCTSWQPHARWRCKPEEEELGWNLYNRIRFK